MPVRLALESCIPADVWTDLNPFNSTAEILAVALTMAQYSAAVYIGSDVPGIWCPPVWRLIARCSLSSINLGRTKGHFSSSQHCTGASLNMCGLCTDDVSAAPRKYDHPVQNRPSYVVSYRTSIETDF